MDDEKESFETRLLEFQYREKDTTVCARAGHWE